MGTYIEKNTVLRKTVYVSAPALELLFSPMSSRSSRKRFSTAGKKSSLGKKSSESVMKPVVARCAPQKPYSPFSRTGLEGGGVPEAYCPGSRCTPQDGMGKNW